MTTITFDTLRYTERLRAAGVPEQQAKAEAEALRDVLSESLDSTLATKSDMRDVRDDVAGGVELCPAVFLASRGLVV
jgi:hypothetical protein